MREISQTASLDNIVEHLDISKILLTIERRTTKTLTGQDYLIFLQVSMFQDHLGTITQGQLLIVEFLTRHLFHNLTSLGHFGNQRLILYIINIRLYLSSTGFVNSLFQRGLSGINSAFFLLVHIQHHHIRVLVFKEALHQLVNSLQGEHGCQLLHHLIIVIQAWDGFIVQIVLHILVNELTIITLVLIGILLIQLADEILLIALILCSGKTKLCSTTSLYESCFQSGLGLSFLRKNTDIKGILGL